MIITCEKCTTRFQLDDTRIPDQGVKVRCSRCKHAFFVKRAELEVASDTQAADDWARQAEEGPAPEEGPARSGPEEATQALEREAISDERTEFLGNSGDDLRGDGGDEEEDWQFNEDPGEPGVGGARPPAAPAAKPAVPSPPEPVAAAPEPEPEPEPEPAADPMSELFDEEEQEEEGTPGRPEGASFDDVGRPEEWNLLGDEEDEGEPEPPPPHRSSGPAAVDEHPLPAASAAPDFEPLEASAPGLEPSRASALGRVFQAGAWLAVVVLLVWTARATLLPSPPAVVSHASDVVVAGLQAEDVEARIVENAPSGVLLVVRATLRNPGDEFRVPDGPLRVRLLDAAGDPLPDTAPVAQAPPEATLRLEDAESVAQGLARQANALALVPVAPGEGIPVAAIFPEWPDAARAFRFEVAGGGEPARAVSSGTSPPSPPPSSG